MDQFYFEEGYVEASYFGYVAEAKISLEPYIEVGYLPADYFYDPSAFAVLSCDAEIVVGMLIEAQSYQTSEFTISASVSKTVSASAAFDSNFTQTAIGSRGRDIDLFAFGEAAIAAQISRIRETNISVTSVFDVATDFVVERSADSDVNAVFSAIINGLRSRDTITETQAAFSFDLTADLFKDFAGNLTAQSNISVTIDVIRDVASNQNTEFAQTISGDRIRFSQSDLQSTITVSATARQIRDVHLTGTGVASITCQPIITASASATPSTSFSLYSNGGYKLLGSAAFAAYAGILVSRYAGTDRPKTVTGTFTSTQLQNSGNRSTNLESLPFNDNWYYQTSVFVAPSTNLQTVDTKKIFYSNLGTKNSIACYLTSSMRYRANEGATLTVGFALGNTNVFGTYSTGVLFNDTIGVNFTVAVSFTGGQKVSLYVNGTRIATGNLGTSGWTIPSPVTFQFAPDFPYTVNSSTHTAYTDYAWLTYGDYTNNGAATYTQPSPLVNTADTIFLYYFNGNGNEALGLTQTAQSAVSSTASLTSVIGGTFNVNANLTAQSSVTAVIGTIEDINLSAFDDAELSVDADVIRDAVSAVEVTASSSCQGNAVRDITQSNNIESTLTVDANRTRDNNIALSASTATVTVANELEGAFAYLESRFFTTQYYYESEYIESGYYEQFEVNVSKTVQGIVSSQITATLSAAITTDVFVAMVTTSSASVTADAVKTTDVVVLEISESTLSAAAKKTTDYQSNIESTFSVFCNGVTGGEINLVAFTNASLSATPEATKPFDSSLESLFTVNANTQDSLNSRGSATISSEFSQSADVNYIAGVVVATDAVASSLTIAVKDVSTDIVCEINAIFSAEAQRTRSASISTASSSVLTVNAVKITDISANFENSTNIGANVVKVVSASITTESIATNLTAVAKVAGFFVNAEVTATVAAQTTVKRSANVSLSAQTVVVVDADTIKNAQSSIASTAQVTAVIGIVRFGSATISSAMSFAVAIRDLRLDEIEYRIPAEGWEYTITGETRNHRINGETRIRNILTETALRTIGSETRIYNIE